MGKIEQAYQENLEVLRNSLLKYRKRQFHKNGVSLDENIQIIESADSNRNSPSCQFLFFYIQINGILFSELLGLQENYH